MAIVASLLGSFDVGKDVILGNFNVTSFSLGTKFGVCKIALGFDDVNESGASDDSIGDLGGIYSEANLTADWLTPLNDALARDLNILI